MSAPWESVREVLEEALAREETERDAWLEQRCADDPELHAEVLSLLREDGESDSFLDRPPGAELLCDALAEEPLELFAGDEIGPYRVRELLASGGMGSVYLAERHGDDFVVPVAIKVIKLGMDSRETVRRFREERRVLARLEHPGIARLLDGGTTTDGRPFLAMEYVRGVPIDRFCADIV